MANRSIADAFLSPGPHSPVSDDSPLPIVVRDSSGTEIGTAENPLVVSGAPAGDATIVDGGDVCEGATDDTAATAGGEGTVSAKLRLMTTQLDALTETIGAADDASETNPAAEVATIASLLRGILEQQAAILAILTDVYDSETHVLNVSSS